MALQIPAEQSGLRERILEGMIDFMQPFEGDDEGHDVGYTQAHVDQCGKILSAYLAAVLDPAAKGASDRIMAAVKTAVLALNDLNDECDGGLIETDQREDICELIISAAALAGLESEEYDITGEWRDW